MKSPSPKYHSTRRYARGHLRARGHGDRCARHSGVGETVWVEHKRFAFMIYFFFLQENQVLRTTMNFTPATATTVHDERG